MEDFGKPRAFDQLAEAEIEALAQLEFVGVFFDGERFTYEHSTESPQVDFRRLRHDRLVIWDDAKSGKRRVARSVKGDDFVRQANFELAEKARRREDGE
jgi:hypothetical protein